MRWTVCGWINSCLCKHGEILLTAVSHVRNLSESGEEKVRNLFWVSVLSDPRPPPGLPLNAIPLSRSVSLWSVSVFLFSSRLCFFSSVLSAPCQQKRQRDSICSTDPCVMTRLFNLPLADLARRSLIVRTLSGTRLFQFHWGFWENWERFWLLIFRLVYFLTTIFQVIHEKKTQLICQYNRVLRVYVIDPEVYVLGMRLQSTVLRFTEFLNLTSGRRICLVPEWYPDISIFFELCLLPKGLLSC